MWLLTRIGSPILLAFVGCGDALEADPDAPASTSVASDDTTPHEPMSSSGSVDPGSTSQRDTSGPSQDSSGDDDGFGEDSGEGGSDGITTGSTGDELVPLQVLSIHGGRFSRSCDGGASWSETWEHNPAADCFHDPDSLYVRPAYGHGLFLVPSGWGDPGAMYVSDDAVTWTRTEGPDLAGLRGTDTEVNSAGAFFDGEQFAVMRRLVSTDGEHWEVSEHDFRPAGGGNIRRMTSSLADDLVVAMGQGLFVSTDWSQTWTETFPEGEVCPAGLQHRGEIVIGHDRIVLGGGWICWSDDLGQSWTRVDTGDAVRDLVVTPQGFVAFHRDGSVHTSDDADAWTFVGMLPFAPDAIAATWGGTPNVLVAIATTNAGQSSMLQSTDGGATWIEMQAGPDTQCPRMNLETFMVPAALCG